MTLVINSLEGGHTHINIQTFANRSNYKKSGTRQPMAGAHLV